MPSHRHAMQALIFFALSSSAQAQVADLAAIKTGPNVAAADSDVSYVLGVDQTGPDTASMITLTDAIPAGMTFVTLSQTAGPSMNCSTPPVGSGGTISCSLAAVASGTSIRFDAVVHIDAQTAPGVSFTNILAVSAAEDPSDENDQAATTLFTPTVSADVSVIKSAPAHAVADSDLTYVLTVQNAGPDAAGNVVLTDTLPGDLTFVSLTQNSGPAIGCTTPAAGTGGSIVCTAPTLANAAAASWNLVAHVPSGTPGGTTYQNTATVSSDNDPSNENDTSTQLTTVSAVDLVVALDLPPQVTAGVPFAATVDWRNDGPDSASQAQWTLSLPANVSFVSITQNSGPSATCSNLGSSVQCIAASMANASSASFTVNLLVAASTVNGSSITLTNSTSSQNAETDPSDNQVSDSASVLGAADAVISKSAPANSDSDSTLAYTITVSNQGFVDATGVHWSDTLPAPTTFVSLVQSGPTFTCTTPAVGSGGDVECDITALAVGASTIFTLTVQVPAGVADGTQITNSVALDATSPEATTANNADAASTLVSGLADLYISKSGPLAAPLGSTIDYSVYISNDGFQPASNAQWTDVLPAGLTFVSLTQSAGALSTCTTPAIGAGGTVQCSIASLAAGESAQFILRVDTDSAALGDLTNDVVASTSSGETSGSNNTGSYTLAIVAAPQQSPPPPQPVPLLSDWQTRLALALLIVFATLALRLGIAARHGSSVNSYRGRKLAGRL